MGKKDYQKPAIQVVELQIAVMQTNSVTGVSSNVDNLKYGGGGNGPDRSRGGGDWDDEED